MLNMAFKENRSVFSLFFLEHLGFLRLNLISYLHIITGIIYLHIWCICTNFWNYFNFDLSYKKKNLKVEIFGRRGRKSFLISSNTFFVSQLGLLISLSLIWSNLRFYFYFSIFTHLILT